MYIKNRMSKQTGEYLMTKENASERKTKYTARSLQVGSDCKAKISIINPIDSDESELALLSGAGTALARELLTLVVTKVIGDLASAFYVWLGGKFGLVMANGGDPSQASNSEREEGL